MAARSNQEEGRCGEGDSRLEVVWLVGGVDWRRQFNGERKEWRERRDAQNIREGGALLVVLLREHIAYFHVYMALNKTRLLLYFDLQFRCYAVHTTILTSLVMLCIIIVEPFHLVDCTFNYHPISFQTAATLRHKFTIEQVRGTD